MRNTLVLSLIALLASTLACNTAPKNEAKRDALVANADAALAAMKADDPSFDDFLDRAYGHVVFPEVGKGGLIVGGAYGRGVVYEAGKMIGYADITQATVGLQAGGQTFAEVIAFENKAAVDRFVNRNYELAAQASAVALKSGAAASAKYTDGVAVFTYVRGGLMAEASIGGQQFRFVPRDRNGANGR
jgi:lipid-binding SYLF domain-containing protein